MEDRDELKKEVDWLKNDKKLEYVIADLLKLGKLHKGKLKMINGICEEVDVIQLNGWELVGSWQFTIFNNVAIYLWDYVAKTDDIFGRCELILCNTLLMMWWDYVIYLHLCYVMMRLCYLPAFNYG